MLAVSTIRRVKFDQFTVVLLVLRPDRPRLDEDAEAELQDAHLAYLASLHSDGVLLAAGPLGGPDDEIRGMSIFGVDADRARELAHADPAVRAGKFAIRIMPWLVPAGAAHFTPTSFPNSAADARSAG